MKGIDVSNWQKGIDLSRVPADFVIVKATEGNYYISDDYERQASQVRKCGKRLGLYHYANGGDVNEEADFFVNNVKPHIGHAILVLDWEAGNNPNFGKNDVEWCRRWCERVHNKTGIKPFIYIQQSMMAKLKPLNMYGLWVAQYADMNQTGYQNEPWNEGAYKCDIRQYSSMGKLAGYSGHLDLNKAYIDGATWDKWAGKKAEPAKKQPAKPAGTTLDLVVATLQGKYGEGETRKARLGSRYNEVQNFINHIAYADINTLANEVMNGKYGSGQTRKVVLGAKYTKVQDAVNKKLNPPPQKVYYTVVAGDTLSGIAAKFNTTYLKIAQLNGIKSPYVIYPGQKLRVK